MDLVLEEWATFTVRWLHVVAGIAWIGSSFYFIHLDLSLKARPGQPEDVAGVVKFLASDAAGYLTGQVLHVSGGMYM